MKKKAQIEMGESMAIIIIFIVLLVLGIVVYGRLKQGSFETEKEEMNVLEAIGVAQKVYNLPELRCSFNNVQVENCIDLIKAQKLEEIIGADFLYYYDLLGKSSITLKKIFPLDETDIKIYQNEPDEWTKKTVTQLPISIFNPLEGMQGEYNYGILVVEVFA